MQTKWLALMALLAALLLAGCSMRAEDDDGDGGEVEVDGDDDDDGAFEDDDDRDSPGAGLLVMLGALGLATVARRRSP